MIEYKRALSVFSSHRAWEELDAQMEGFWFPIDRCGNPLDKFGNRVFDVMGNGIDKASEQDSDH
jgi:hypothetical protein